MLALATSACPQEAHADREYVVATEEETSTDLLAGTLVKIDDTPLGAAEEGCSVVCTDETTVPDSLTGALVATEDRYEADALTGTLL